MPGIRWGDSPVFDDLLGKAVYCILLWPLRKEGFFVKNKDFFGKA
jgi:hypothetical protein